MRRPGVGGVTTDQISGAAIGAFIATTGPKGDRRNYEIFQDRLNGIPPLNLLSGEKAATLRVLRGVLSLDRLGAGFQHLCLHVAIGFP